jgi:DNA polymerase-3 subunit delta
VQSFLVTGAEAFLAERACFRLIKAARAADPTAERQEIIAGSESAAGDLAMACGPTLFGDGAIVLLDGIEDAAEDLQATVLALLAESPDHVTLVLVHGGGVKGRGFVDRCKKAVDEVITVEKPKGRGVDDFIASEFASHRRKVTGAAIAALRAAIGDDARALASAVSQLAADVESNPIDVVDVEQYHEGVAGASAFTISDAVWDGRAVPALIALRWALDSDPGFGPAVVASAAGALRSLVRLAGAPPGMSDADLAREIGAQPWKLRSLRDQLRRWKPGTLADAAVLLATLDAQMKGGDGVGLDPVQKQVVLETTLLRIARSR